MSPARHQRSSGAARAGGPGADVPAGAQLEVFTTRPDTLFGATYLVVAPEHALLGGLTAAAQGDEVRAYVAAAAAKSDLERTELAKRKTGMFTGAREAPPGHAHCLASCRVKLTDKTLNQR